MWGLPREGVALEPVLELLRLERANTASQAFVPTPSHCIPSDE